MSFRVPLLFPSVVVLQRLDTRSTRLVDPDGLGPLTSGYDDDLREPIPYEEVDLVDDSKNLRTTVRYLPPLRLPCQVETRTFEELNQVYQGDATLTNMVFVLHRMDLQRMGLIGTDEGCSKFGGTLLKVNDKITAIEKQGFSGQSQLPLKFPLYVMAVLPGSWGMGDGHDLEMLLVSNRPALAGI